MTWLLAIGRFLSQVVALVFDKLRQATAWLRKPGNGRKALARALFLAAIVWAATASLSSWRLNDQVVVVTRERDVARAERERDAVAFQAERTTFKEQEARFAAAQRRAWAAMERAQEAAGKAQEAARQAQANRNKGNAAWLRVYEGRGDVCKAAEEAVGVACKSVGRL